MLSEARAVPVSAAPMPAVAESSNACRRLNLARSMESGFDMMFPFGVPAVELFDRYQHLGERMRREAVIDIVAAKLDFF